RRPSCGSTPSVSVLRPHSYGHSLLRWGRVTGRRCGVRPAGPWVPRLGRADGRPGCGYRPRAARWPGRSGQGRGQLVYEALPALLGGDVPEQDVLPGALEDVLELAASLRRDLGGGAELGLDGVEVVHGHHVGLVEVGDDRLAHLEVAGHPALDGEDLARLRRVDEEVDELQRGLGVRG